MRGDYSALTSPSLCQHCKHLPDDGDASADRHDLPGGRQPGPQRHRGGGLLPVALRRTDRLRLRRRECVVVGERVHDRGRAAGATDHDAPASAGLRACPVTGTISPAGDADFFGLGAPASGSRIFASSTAWRRTPPTSTCGSPPRPTPGSTTTPTTTPSSALSRPTWRGRSLPERSCSRASTTARRPSRPSRTGSMPPCSRRPVRRCRRSSRTTRSPRRTSRRAITTAARSGRRPTSTSSASRPARET